MTFAEVDRLGQNTLGKMKSDVSGKSLTPDRRKVTHLNQLDELPDKCWNIKPIESRGCRYYTKAQL